jgi:hypothetical protein
MPAWLDSAYCTWVTPTVISSIDALAFTELTTNNCVSTRSASCAQRSWCPWKCSSVMSGSAREWSVARFARASSEAMRAGNTPSLQ